MKRCLSVLLLLFSLVSCSLLLLHAGSDTYIYFLTKIYLGFSDMETWDWRKSHRGLEREKYLRECGDGWSWGGTCRDKYSEILTGERPPVRDLMNKHLFALQRCNYGPSASSWNNWCLKMLLEPSGHRANWFSTYMMPMIDHWECFGSFSWPPIFCTILGFHPR